MNSLPDYSAYYSPNSSQEGPPRSRNGSFEIVLVSIVLGIFFALLAFGMMMLGSRTMNESQQATCGVMCFDEDRLALFLGIGIGLEGAVGGFFASLVLLSILERKPVGRVMGRTLLIHSIPVSALSFLLGATEQGSICGVGAFVGGSFAITCALVAYRTQDNLD